MGALYDVNTLLRRLIPVRAFCFTADLLMMLAFALMFETWLIAYTKGAIRGYYVLLCALSYFLYMLSIHKIVNPVFMLLTEPLTKFYNYLSKKLKKSKKSFKKVLHFNKK